MSRSYKKNPVCTDGSPGTTKRTKRRANKKIRQISLTDLPIKGTGYKKFFCSYNIHDYIIYMPKEKWKKSYYSIKKKKYFF